MKKLYVSDLDGTLLNNEAVLSEFSINNLNKLINDGINFTIATSRGYSGIKKIKRLRINIPIILLNGALIYNVQKKQYIKIEKINQNIIIEILNIAENTKQDSLILYSIYDNRLNEYFKISNNEDARKMREKSHKNMLIVDSFYQLLNHDIIYFNFKDKKEKITLLYEKIKSINEIDYVIHKDVYSDDLWFLECFSKKSNKYNAINFLRNEYKFDKVIAFGDGKNDLPLAENSDEFYATENADNDIKKISKEIIGNNNDDGVVKWLLNNVEE